MWRFEKAKERYFTAAGMSELTQARTNPQWPEMPQELRSAALCCLVEIDPVEKASKVFTTCAAWESAALTALTLDTALVLHPEAPVPGRPARPELVPPLAVQHRSMRSPEGRAALVHALAHIEFNAINLALDVIWRFAGMPADFYADWLQVAFEEAQHFNLLSAHLHELGFAYGDFPAHNSLWDMADKTSGDVLARIALVPRTLEARGLDASPAVRAKLAQAGDLQAAAILDVILRDEVGHVATGNRWYAWLCIQRGLEPLETFRQLCRDYKAPAMRPPFNIDARRAAGFTDAELTALLEQDDVPGQDTAAGKLRAV